MHGTADQEKIIFCASLICCCFKELLFKVANYNLSCAPLFLHLIFSCCSWLTQIDFWFIFFFFFLLWIFLGGRNRVLFISYYFRVIVISFRFENTHWQSFNLPLVFDILHIQLIEFFILIASPVVSVMMSMIMSVPYIFLCCFVATFCMFSSGASQHDPEVIRLFLRTSFITVCEILSISWLREEIL